jgi:hypothetical protein
VTRYYRSFDGVGWLPCPAEDAAEWFTAGVLVFLGDEQELWTMGTAHAYILGEKAEPRKGDHEAL